MTSAQIGRTHPDWAPSKDESRTTPGPASPCRQPKDRVSCPWRIPMRLLMFVLCVISSFGSLSAQKPVWQPSPGHTQISIWPGAAPDPQPVAGPEYAETSGKDFLPGGRPAVGVSNVTRPTMTVYSPKGKNTPPVQEPYRPRWDWVDTAIIVWRARGQSSCSKFPTLVRRYPQQPVLISSVPG